MNRNKVTIQDIARELGLSRNTVSKALNGSPNLATATKEKILRKAMEMNYKHFAYVDSNFVTVKKTGNIVFLSSNPFDPNFWSYVIKGIEKRVSDEGFNFSIKIIQPEELAQKTLPGNFNTNDIDGIICSEIFNKDYINTIISTNIPTILIDTVSDISFSDLACDVIFMENEHSVFKLTTEIIKRGHTQIGFVGLPEYCRSFYERWLGFNRALHASGLEPNPDFNIIPKCDSYDYDWIKEQIQNMSVLPTSFVCANDSIAINTMIAIKNLNLSIPSDISVCGFDDSPQSLIVNPTLTTVHTHKEELGSRTAETLFWRMDNPKQPFQVTYMKTDVILRDSLEGVIKKSNKHLVG